MGGWNLSSTAGMPKKKKGKSMIGELHDFRKCDDLKVRIKTYCKQQKITQTQLATDMKVSYSSMRDFMAGNAGVNSCTYQRGMIFLRTKMPLTKCTEPVAITSSFDKGSWGVAP
jgi:predicted XRE-type DNA-binding protein